MKNPVKSTRRNHHILTLIIILVIPAMMYSCSGKEKREIISLNGEWELALRSAGEGIPIDYEGTVQVPGLADMASFAIDSLGLPYYEKRDLWYRKTFRSGTDQNLKVFLKLHKVKFGHTVYLNGFEIGSSDHCFTPASYDVSGFINGNGEENELVIRVGAFTDNLETPAVYGADFEKIRYLPGVYDDVQLIMSGEEHLTNVQVAPDINTGKLEVGIIMTGARPVNLKYAISEKQSGEKIATGKLSGLNWEDSLALTEIPLKDFRLWTPEDPFLYILNIESSNDSYTTTFGMRDFKFNPGTGRAELNGETYFMRGTNVCIFRFFEDPDRKGLPWDTAWVRELHRKFKSMHWNSIRYCISAPPRFWYDIADEEGLLIQDEYPIWTGIAGSKRKGFEGIYPNLTAELLAEEYREWMMERWNHPCIVIWDAQNESVTEVTGDAIEMVRELDMSEKPWENGWARPQSPEDPIETHPYRFTKYLGTKVSGDGPLKELISAVQIPDNGPSERMPPENGEKYPNPIIINEYGWLWLNRDGSTTTLTDWVYPNAFGPDLTKEERLELYGRHLGILTEYWRAHRTCAGVLHFCGLAYSRSEEPRGQTSDHFVDIKNLEFEPNFVKYVKPAFNPVGLFINWFEQEIPAKSEIEIPFVITNDLNKVINGQLKMEWIGKDITISVGEKEIQLEPFARNEQSISIKTPSDSGRYEMILHFKYNGNTVESRRLCRAIH
ncbi:MAG: hypothetical protein K9J30_05570 [Bacteroidales bacterium]|nr:hypothetical protein [Bacteroidales bacterium]